MGDPSVQKIDQPAVQRTYRIRHSTVYSYSATMTDGYTVAALTPRPTPWQDVLATQIVLDPEANEADQYQDVFGNRISQFGLHEPHTRMSIEADSTVVVTERTNPRDPTPWEAVVDVLDGLSDALATDVCFFRGASTSIDLERWAAPLRALADAAFPPGTGIIDGARSLCDAIHREFVFDPASTDISTPLGQVLDQRRGVCQDFAHVATAVLRSLGLAARYVSGYVETEPPPGHPRLVGADASHAWCSIWTPDQSWVDFDPTNGHLPVNHHVTVAWGRDYADVTPVRGVMIGPSAGQSLQVSVDVAPV
ncbi:MAG: transglutaminase family protein [Actinomycetota bacterium]|nr:transglutaminase family protein [Actinomycetota bacterium]